MNVTFNQHTYTADTPDGTFVPVELIGAASCIGDLAYLWCIRDHQRKQMSRGEKPTALDPLEALART